MKGLLAGVFAAVLAVVIGAVLFFVFIDQTETTERPQENRTHTIEGRQQTCAEFFGETCDFSTQEGFNRWGNQLDDFITEERRMGSFARDIGFTETGKIAIHACVLTQTSDNTVEDLVAIVRQDHPDVTTAQVFPIWNAARWHLCPLPR